MIILIYDQEVTPFIPYAGDGLEPLVYSIDPVLPAGLFFNTDTGEITGTPSVLGTPTNYTVTWVDALSQTDSQSFSLVVDTLLTATVLIADQILTVSPFISEFTPILASGGTEPLVYSISPDLPLGLSIVPEIGLIAGAPVQISSLTNHVVTVTDVYGQSTGQSFTLTINPIPLTVSQSISSRTLTINQPTAPFTPVTAVGGYGALTYTIESALPSGLLFDSGTGEITGASTLLLDPQIFTVTVNDTIGQSGTGTFVLSVDPVELTSIRYVISKTLTVDQLASPFTPVIGSGGYGAISYSISPDLPGGLSFNSVNGQITGTPTQLTSATTYTVTVEDTVGQISSQEFLLDINPVPLTVTRLISIKNLTINRAESSFIPVSATGGYGAISYQISSSLPTGLSFNTGTAAISGTASVLSSATNYTITAQDSVGQTGNRTFSLAVDPVPLVTVLSSSTRSLLVNLQIIPFTPVTASGGYGTSTFSISPNLLGNLSFSTSTGTITGIPVTTTATTVYTITAQDTVGQTSSRSFSLEVQENPFLLDTFLELPDVRLIKNLAVDPFTPVRNIGGNGILRYVVFPALPTGLLLNSASGEIYGTPTVASSSTIYSVTIYDGLNQFSSKNFSLEVSAPLLTITTNFSNLILNQNISNANVIPVSGNGGYGTLVYSIDPLLPTGLSFSTSTGKISGIPSQSIAETEYAVTVTDQIGQSLTRSFSLIVNQLFFSTVFTLTEGIFVSRPISTPIVGTAYSVISGKLPPGLSLTQDGILSGSPDTVVDVTRSRFVVRAKNSELLVDTTFNIDITGADDPAWSTAEGYLPVGIRGEKYALNNQWVDYNLSAAAVEAPVETAISYYIADGAGRLPPGLKLDPAGKISGFIKDKLTFDSDISLDGGYDTESYDGYSYDHSAGFIGTASDLTITGLPKIYQFRVTATDGVNKKERLFKIVVASTDILQYNSTSMPIDIVISTATSYIQYPQWINGSDLGTIRANNNQILDVTAYDGAPLVGTITYTIVNGQSISTQLPEGLYLSSSNGYIHGFVPYQPAYSRKYSLTINATKNNKTTNQSVTATNTFTLTVKGDIESNIEWVSDSNLGIIQEGITSELAIVARQIKSDYTLKYQQTLGSLPPGMELKRDGSLSGQADYGSSGTYAFSVVASDVYELSAIERMFTLTVDPYDSREYTKIWARPFLSSEKRTAYREFTSNEFTFDPKLIYRKYDTNFGVQTDPKLILEFGIEKLNLANYVTALKENFYRRRLYFGDVKVAVAKDQTGKIIYELVYVDIIDELVNLQGQSVNPVIYSDNKIYYPSSISNMRRGLRSIVLENNTYIGINLDTTPKFMTTPQAGYYNSTDYITVVPICYALPQQGNRILSRIKLSGFDFKMLDFEIDRLIVQNSQDNSTAKYLIFERQSISDMLATDDYLFGISDMRLDDENNNPLIRE